MISERVAAAVPQPQDSGIPQEWLIWEQGQQRRIAEAGASLDDVDWRYVFYLLNNNQMAVADSYIGTTLDSLTPKITKPATATPSAASAAAASKEWWEKLDDPKVPQEEKIKIMKEQKIL
jgi:hypothetical protein